MLKNIKGVTNRVYSFFFELIFSYVHVITFMVLLPLSFSCTVGMFSSSYRVLNWVNDAEMKDTSSTLLLLK